MWIMRNLIRRFREDYIDIPEGIERDALCAALLHDVGHGPLSHVFEHLTERKFDHEKMTRRMIQQTELRDIVDDPTRVVNLLNGLAPKDYRWVSELLSGPLDADKMDYLLRDSHYTGTDYGRYDFHRFSQSLLVYESQGVRHIGVLGKGIAAAEAFILARDRMFWSVYFHKTTRAVEKLVMAIFKRGKDLLERGKNIEINDILQSVLVGRQLEPKDMLEFDDLSIDDQLRKWRRASDSILSDLSRKYFNRDVFKTLLVPTQRVALLTQKRNEITRILQDQGLDPDYYYFLDDPTMLPYAAGFPPDEGAQVAVLFMNKDGDVQNSGEITEFSPIIRLLRDEKKTEFRVHSTANATQKIAQLIKA
jgi:HD superfamily phosphohydrolase